MTGQWFEPDWDYLQKTGGVEKKSSLRIELENSAQEGWLVTVWVRSSMLKLSKKQKHFPYFPIPNNLY